LETIFKIDFYKELYLDELKRKDKIDALISYPTTLLTILIGGGLYFLKKENFKHITECETILLNILTSLFFISIAFSIFFLMRMFLNKFKKYKYLPLSIDLYNRELELITYYKENSDNNKKNQIRKEAKKHFQNDLLKYYIDFATKNQMINDERLKDFYTSRKILMLSLIFLSISWNINIYN